MQTSFKYLVATLAGPALLAGAALAVIRQPDSPPASADRTAAAAATTAPLPELATSVPGVPTDEPATQVTIANPPPATATPVTESPTVVPGAPEPVELPRVLSMRSDHAGPGAVIVRFSANVPVTAEIRVMSEQDGEEFFFSDTLGTLATEHEVSVPANFGRYVVIIEDESGNQARGTLRYGADPEGIDFDNGEFAPALDPQTAKKLLVSWGFADDHPGYNDEPGRVLIYTTDASCTTADSCVGQLIGPAIHSGIESNPEADYHTVLATIPGSAFDYQVVIANSLSDDETHAAFLQLEIRGDQLPKTNFAGPSSLSQ